MLMMCSFQVMAQQVRVQGVILDRSDSSPLIGVNVFNEANLDQGVTTDYDGRFSLMTDPGTTLTISYIGYTSQRLTVTGPEEVTIYLEEDATQLDEVVVVGYGIQKKKVATGSVSKITTKNLEGLQVQDVQSALEGQVSGLMVNESSGQPGAGKSLLIRGISTNGDNSPLFIVDGLQVNGIDNINPNDIESVDILKDAASSAIYGARAANGVVIITTKKGTKGQSQLTYEGFTSISRPWKLPEMLNAQQYIDITREKFANGNQLNSLVSQGFPTDATNLPNTNWMEEIFEPAMIQSHRLSATSENLFVSLEYWDQEGVVGGDKSNYQRYAARINGSKQINDYVKIGENLYVNRVNNQSIGVNNAFGTVIADAFAYDPITPVYDPTKQYGFAQSKWVQKEYINPLSRLFLTNADGHADQVLGNVYLKVSPVSWLRFHSDLGVDYNWYKFRSFVPDYDFHPAFQNPTNDISQGYGFSQALQVENYINLNHQFQGGHQVDVVLGTSYRQTENEFAGGSSSSIPDAVKFDPNWQWLNSGEDTTDLTYGSAGVDYALISYYGRVIYDYKNKYLFTGTLRQDGSSNFGANNRWGLFPSLSVGWVVTEEPFFQYAPLSFLKVRGSWGINGNDRIAPLAYASRVENVFTYAFGVDPTLYTGAALATPPNPDIKWEQSEQIDFGVESRWLNDRLTIELDYFQKTTKDLLMNQIIPGYIGATNNPISNLGEIRNRGFEAAIGYQQSFRGVNFNANLTYTTFKNEVTRVAGESGFLQGYVWPVRNTPITRMTEGFPVGHFVGYQAAGIFQSQAEVFSYINNNGDPLQPKAKPGDLKFVDVNGDGVIDSKDITDIGSPWPAHILGLTLSARYKGFDVSVILSAQLGHQIFRAYERSDITFTNYQTFWEDRWTETNPSSELPRLVTTDPNNNQRPSSFYVEDASFLRVRNLQIGYSLSPKLLQRMPIRDLRIYLSANNLLTLTRYRGFDPDIGTNGWILDTGIDKGYYPSNQTIGGGVRITL